jgi:hypothetical protein
MKNRILILISAIVLHSCNNNNNIHKAADELYIYIYIYIYIANDIQFGYYETSFFKPDSN